jgi:alpha-beta hydrolase superfamily lysophospholipase
MKRLIFCTIIILAVVSIAADRKTITFPSGDGLEITADLYMAHSKEAPFIILYHQAGWSRGEYLEIAPNLNKMGYNCIAVDQRSGDGVNEILNLTHQRAVKANKGTTYIDAYIDMKSALDYVRENYTSGKIILWGSSYSAALAFVLASESKDYVDGVLAFAPGEYFAKLGKSKTYVSTAAQKLSCPVFITSARSEKSRWEEIYNSLQTKDKNYFLPETQGNHGSRALWKEFSDSNDYWKAVKKFLGKYFTTGK